MTGFGPDPKIWDATHTVLPSGEMASGPAAAITGIAGPGVLFDVAIGVTDPLGPNPESTTYTVHPLGVTATPLGNWPTVIGSPATRVRTSIGVTVSTSPTLSSLVTYAVRPSGVMAMPPVAGVWLGLNTGIGIVACASRPRTEIGVTES